MSGRPLLRLPIRQTFKQAFQPTRRIHTAPKRPQFQTRSNPIHNGQKRFKGSFAENAQKLFRENPVSVSLAIVAMIGGVTGIVYANIIYQEYIIKSFHKYPEEVAKKLRRALYYTNYDLNPQEALKYYKQALQVASEIGMDPVGDEIMGVKIQVAKLMEDIEQYPNAIHILEAVRGSNLLWLEKFGSLPENKERRTKVLGKTVGVSVKLGELYGTPEVWDRDMAQERLVWAVETVLKEKQRRENANVKDEDEGPWMNDEEIGATLESLAHSYEAKDQHYLAAPLFLQALALQPTKDCHTIVLMSNVASSLAQQSPRMAREAQAYATSQNINTRPSGPAATRETMLENAKTWAQKALDVAATIKPPVRTEECDIGCAVALHNLGEFAEMAKDPDSAKRQYQEAISLARAIGFEEGVAQSSERLRALSSSG
ncbi:hypothetical protein PRZ48_004890 [Zasmidium cellare]|uniref:TPR domain protein n=1 Tax=Zasmidium cellare TaxID=395010 RepID=A0ABR0ER65_ZASCE|nr:hypothetical protein PRZ48_004890 [Zasmidium cellare]